MSQNASAQLDEDHLERIETMVEEGHADSKSEAIRMCLSTGFEHYGVTPHTESDTRLRETARRLAFGFAMVGAVVLGLTYFGSLSARLLGIVPWMMALGCYGLDRALAKVEPSVSNRLRRLFPNGSGRLFGGEKA